MVLNIATGRPFTSKYNVNDNMETGAEGTRGLN